MGRSLYRLHRWLYRRTRGVVGHRSPEGPILLLETTGRRSSQPRTVPLLYFKNEGFFYVVASNGGRPSYPGWFLNVRVNSRVKVQVGPRRLNAVAQVIEQAERNDLWPQLTAFYSGWAHYETLTSRPIPVVRISPVA